MKLKFLILLFFTVAQFSYSQLITSFPEFATENDSITIFFDATQGNKGLMGYTGDVYAHTGVITNFSTSSSDWKHVVSNWGENTADTKLIRDSLDHYHFVIGYPRQYYNRNPELSLSEEILKLAFVFRSATASNNGSYFEGKDVGNTDIFYTLFTAGTYSLVLNSPTVSNQFGDPLRSPLFANSGDTINVIINAAALGTQSKDITLFVNGTQKTQTTASSLNYELIINADFSNGSNNITIIGTDTTTLSDTLSFNVFLNSTVTEQALPTGNELGINYNNSTVTLALFAPYKSFVYVLGDFNDWKVDQNYFMKKQTVTADSVIWWFTFNVTSGQEYSFQYLVDGNLRIADPFTEKVLDPWNDQYIPTSIYPSNLIQYPTGKTDQIVSVLQTDQTPYNWQVTNFVKPDKKKLTVYELLIRDFVATHSYKTLTDTLNYLKNLGINAIELMPVMEFEGNSSWGYNTSFHMALDKYYGTKNDLKDFIDAAHANGIAVFLDIVLNHAYGQNPLARLYWDSANNRPAGNNPWFNATSPNKDFSFGNDFNHESPQTKYYVDRVTNYWITEYHIDGYRFDFTKGFTNVKGDGSGFDQSRINLLERMGNVIWQNHPSSALILEHFAPNTEETILANFGFLLWSNMNYNYTEASMGFLNNSDLRWTSYIQRGWSVPNSLAYMESHDVERMMYKNKQSGNSSGSYNIKYQPTGLDRVKLASTFFYLIPGPKMLWQFGELGYDISINQGGRTSEKPILWNYYTNSDRQKLYKTIAVLIKLRTSYEAFSTTNFSLAVDNAYAVKKIYLNGDSMNVSVFGNFDVNNQSTIANFQHTGLWYDYFTGESLNVISTSMSIPFTPGEYHIYTDVKLPVPDLIVTDVKKNDNAIITDYKLFQNYPNPFNPSTTINYSIPSIGTSHDLSVQLKVFDVLGREVATLVNKEQSTGNYSVIFDASFLSSGIYFYTLRAGNFIQTKKLILLK